MTEPKPDRPWWRKRRWPAIGLLWLVAAYPLSTGPVLYGAHRGWVPAGLYYAYCWPAMRGLNNAAGVATGYWDWVAWWESLARADGAD